VRWDLVWVMALVVVLAEGLLSQAHGAASPQGLLAADRLDVIPSRSSESAVKTVKPQFVREAQRALRDLGYRPGPIDGIVGAQTHAALAKYRDAEKLPVTGDLDPETMARLDVHRRLFRARAS